MQKKYSFETQYKNHLIRNINIKNEIRVCHYGKNKFHSTEIFYFNAIHNMEDKQTHLKLGIDYAQLPRASVRARQTCSFVYALLTVFVSSTEAQQLRVAVDRRCFS
jgi:hypothetical protein